MSTILNGSKKNSNFYTYGGWRAGTKCGSRFIFVCEFLQKKYISIYHLSAI